jgi:hypothetical protein
MRLPHPDWTPEEKSRICAEMRAQFTDEDALEYERILTGDEPLMPFDDVIRRMEEEERIRQLGRN